MTWDVELPSGVAAVTPIDEPQSNRGEAWVDLAACRDADPDVFFPEKGGSTRHAKRICAGCPVASQCLEVALAEGERIGIWGGLSERERRRLAPRERRTRTSEAECGTAAGYQQHRKVNEPACVACRRAYATKAAGYRDAARKSA